MTPRRDGESDVRGCHCSSGMVLRASSCAERRKQSERVLWSRGFHDKVFVRRNYNRSKFRFKILQENVRAHIYRMSRKDRENPPGRVLLIRNCLLFCSSAIFFYYNNITLETYKIFSSNLIHDFLF